MAKRSGQPFTMRTEWKAGPTNRLGKSSGAASSPAHSVGSAFRPPAARIEDLCALLAAPRSRMAPSLPDPACAAAHTGSSAMCFSLTPNTLQRSGAACGHTGNAARGGLPNCADASTVVHSHPGLGVRCAFRIDDVRETGGTTSLVAGVAGPGKGLARRCWSEMGTAAWRAGSPVFVSRSTASCRSLRMAQTLSAPSPLDVTGAGPAPSNRSLIKSQLSRYGSRSAMDNA